MLRATTDSGRRAWLAYRAVIPIPDRCGVKSLAMKILACFVLLSAILAPSLVAQTQANPAAVPMSPYIRVSAGVADKLLVHKVEPVLSQAAMEAHGTTVLIIEIGKNGNVLFAKVISGPAMLRKPVLDAVRKYKYNPYLLNGKPVDVETSVSVVFDLEHSCP